jgi:hypothetical protein
MNDFLVKPMSPDALRAMLSRWTGAQAVSDRMISFDRAKRAGSSKA